MTFCRKKHIIILYYAVSRQEKGQTNTILEKVKSEIPAVSRQEKGQTNTECEKKYVSLHAKTDQRFIRNYINN